MKKILIVCMIAMMTMVVAVGCGNGAVDNQPVQETQPAQEQQVTEPTAAPEQQNVVTDDGVAVNPADANLIGEDRAKQIAIGKVDGATVDDIWSFDLDYDDGRWKYEGEIHQGDWEYEFEINGETGDVISWEKDHIYD